MGILHRIRYHHKKAKNIIIDGLWKFAKQFVLFARRKNKAIATEELTGLIEEMNDMGKMTRWKPSPPDYRRLQKGIITKAIEYDGPLYFVDPGGTSKLCYRCGAELVSQGRLGICPNCSFIVDRDKNAAINIHKRMGVPGSLLRVPAVKDETRKKRGNKR